MARRNQNKKNKTYQQDFNIKNIKPLTQNQNSLYEEYNKGKNIFNVGIAGTGKSFNLLFLALKDILEISTEYNKLIVIRSAVQGRDIGATPGGVDEKISEYEEPYKDITNKLIGRGDAYQILKQKGFIDFKCTSFLRGITWDNSIIFIDEAQNLTEEELLTVFTRIGKNSKLLVAGDYTSQCDLNKRKESSGISTYLNIAKLMECFSIIEYDVTDICRSDFLYQFYIAKNRYEQGYEV